MKPVANGEFLDVAKLGVELGDGVAGLIVPRHAAILCEARTPSPVDDLFLKQSRAALVDAVGLCVFLQQSFKLGHAAMQPSLRERRRQMPDRDRAKPPLRLHGLARIVDDEGINHGDRAENGFGEAGWRQRKRLARQPFECAVRAEMDHGVDALALPEPGIEGDIAMPRRAGHVVIALLAIGRGAAIRLETGSLTFPALTQGKRKQPAMKVGSISGAPHVSASRACKASGRAARKAR